MKHKTTHLFKSFLALLVLMLGATSAWADTFKEGVLTYEYTPGESVCCVTTCEKSVTGVLEIPETVLIDGKTYTVTSIGTGAFVRCKGLTSVTLSSSITSIGTGAFFSCGLTSVFLPESLEHIGERAFSSSDLESVIIPGKVKNIGNNVFYACAELTSVVLSEGVESIDSGAFENSYNLASIVLPEGLEHIGDNAFHFTGLTSVTIPSSVISIGNEAFYQCEKLTSAVLNEGLVSIGKGAFGQNPVLHSLHIPSTVTTIGETPFEEFWLGGGMEEVTVDPKNTAFYSENGMALYGVKDGKRLVWASKKLPSITLPEGLTSIDPMAFMCNNNITEVVIPEGVTVLRSYTFFDCNSLKTLTLPKGLKRIEDSAIIFNDTAEGLTSINIPNDMDFFGRVFDFSKDIIIRFDGFPPLSHYYCITMLLDRLKLGGGSGKLLVPKGCKDFYLLYSSLGEEYAYLIEEGDEHAFTTEEITTFYNKYMQFYKDSLTAYGAKIGDELFDVNAEKLEALKSSVASIYDAPPTTLEELEARLAALPNRGEFNESCKSSLLNIYANTLYLRNASTNEYLGGLSEKNELTLSNDINATSFWRFEGSGLPQDDNVEGILFNVAAGQYLCGSNEYTSDKDNATPFIITPDTMGNHIGYVFEPCFTVFNGQIAWGWNGDDSLANLWYIETAPTKPKDGRYLFSNFDSPEMWLAPAANKNMVAIPRKATRAVWEVKTVDGGYTLQNVLTGLYAKAGEDASHAWTLTEEPQTLQLYLNDGDRAGSVTFGVEGKYNKMHKDNANNIVNWSSDPRTSWVLTPYTIDMAEDLAKAENEQLATDMSSYRQIADLLGGELNADNLTLNDLMREDWNVYQLFAGNYYRFTNVAQGKALGVDASGVPAGTDASENDMNQLWQLVPAGDGFKLYNPDQGAVDKSKAYLSAMQAGSPAPAASLTSADAACVYHIRMADASAQTFRFAYGMGTHDCINMEGAGYASGSYILDSWGGDNSVFTCVLVEDVDFELLDIDAVRENTKIKAIYSLDGKRVSATKPNQMYIIEYRDGKKVKAIVKK